jgi:hypothetical protein
MSFLVKRFLVNKYRDNKLEEIIFMLSESIYLQAEFFILLQKANLIVPESDLKTFSGHT